VTTTCPLNDSEKGCYNAENINIKSFTNKMVLLLNLILLRFQRTNRVFSMKSAFVSETIIPERRGEFLPRASCWGFLRREINE
jgi:hypothetical protein